MVTAAHPPIFKSWTTIQHRRRDMLTKTKIALAAALVLGSTASAALARGSYGGPVQTWCDINPACSGWDSRMHQSHGNAGNSYGYAASPNRASHARSHAR
jgi:hypothetical protein